MTFLPSATAATPWIRSLGCRTVPRHRLVCFPHAGGSASFFTSWAARLPEDCELWAVQYPGRENRVEEPFIDRMSALAGAVAEALLPRLSVPLVLFGHSMGASVAYEVARRLALHRPDAVRHLFVSGRMAPHRQPVIPPGEMTHLRPDHEIVALLTSFGGSDASLLEDRAMWPYILPPVRNDYRLIESYRAHPGPALPFDITALMGAEDATLDAGDVRAWRETGRGRFAFETFPGGHFYLIPRQAEVIARVSATLRQLSDRRAADAAGSPEEAPEEKVIPR
ncbi:thioesterase II family protein [Streptomyces sp. URMC 123]|uniref:thioesterase II family protein n=1 Tax=Streptomyces sp. URMC 123 TaxID=3423403 RepID=UPI003F1B9B50